MAESLTWIAGDASTYVLYSASATDRGVERIDGIGLPVLEHQAQLYPFLHGMLDIARRFRERMVLIDFQQSFSTRSTWQTGRIALAAAFNPDLGKGQLKFVDANANDWRLDAWVVRAPLGRRGGSGPFEIQVDLELWAPWPFWRKATAETDTGDFNGASNVDVAVSNDGNMPTIPTTIVLASGAGETITNPILTILSSGKKISLNHTIAAGETAIITCFPPNEANIVKAGSSIMGNLSYDSVLVGFELPRGNSTVRITGTVPSMGNCLITFNEWFLAV